MHPRGGRVWGERLLAPRRQEMGEQGKDQDQASHSETLLLPMRKKLLEPHKISLSAKEQCGSPWGHISYPNDNNRRALVPVPQTDHSIRVALPSYRCPGPVFHYLLSRD